MIDSSLDFIADLMGLENHYDDFATNSIHYNNGPKDAQCQTLPILPDPNTIIHLAVVQWRSLGAPSSKYSTEIICGHHFHNRSTEVKTGPLRIPIYDVSDSIEIILLTEDTCRERFTLQIPLININGHSSVIMADWFALTQKGHQHKDEAVHELMKPQPLENLRASSIRSRSAPGSFAKEHLCELDTSNRNALTSEEIPAIKIAWRALPVKNRKRQKKPRVITYKEMGEIVPFERLKGAAPVYEPHPGDPIDLRVSELLERRSSDLAKICRIYRRAPGHYLLNGRMVQLSLSTDPLHAESGGISVMDGPLLSQCLVPYLQGSCATAKYAPLPDYCRSKSNRGGGGARSKRLSFGDDHRAYEYTKLLGGPREGQARLDAMRIAVEQVELRRQHARTSAMSG